MEPLLNVMLPTTAQWSKVTCNKSRLSFQGTVKIVIQVTHTFVLPVRGSLDLGKYRIQCLNNWTLKKWNCCCLSMLVSFDTASLLVARLFGKNGFRRWRCVRSNGTTILTGKSRTTGRNTCPGTTLSPTKSTRTGPGSSPGRRGEMPTTNCLSHGTSFRLGGGRRRGVIFCPVLPEFRKTTLFYLKIPRLHSLFLMITLKFIYIWPIVYIKIQSLYQSKQTPFPLKTAFSCSGKNNHCIFWEPHERQKQCVGKVHTFRRQL